MRLPLGGGATSWLASKAGKAGRGRTRGSTVCGLGRPCSHCGPPEKTRTGREGPILATIDLTLTSTHQPCYPVFAHVTPAISSCRLECHPHCKFNDAGVHAWVSQPDLLVSYLVGCICKVQISWVNLLPP